MKRKRFLSYEEQIELLQSKNLHIGDKNYAIKKLKQFSYYSLITGYKDIFKIEKNGNYRDDASFQKILYIYEFDSFLRTIFLQNLIRIEKHIKSLYSYSFCEIYGDEQNNYLDVNNYNYSKYQSGVNSLVSILGDIINNSSKYKYVNYNITTYGTVPLWIIMQTLTFGNISKMFQYSHQELQSQIAKEFKNVYPHHLESMLSVMSKFRNVCAHGERLYNYTTTKSIKKLNLYDIVDNYDPASRNDLFSIVICFKYLLEPSCYQELIRILVTIIDRLKNDLGNDYFSLVLDKMGFPENWKEIALLDL